jgi:RNA polymerase sigma-70 factor (ECF subfamily)
LLEIVTRRDYLNKVSGGSESQFETDIDDFFRRYTPALRRLVWAYVHSAPDGEDLFQEIAVALWKALPKFRGDSSERTYVYRVAHNTAISFVASRRRRSLQEQPSEEKDPEPISSANPEHEAMRNQRRQRLQAAVQELPVIDRQIILLYLEGLSIAEIEAVTGFTEGKVAMRLSRARKRLAERLNQVRMEQDQ